MPRVRHLAVASAMALIASAQTSSAPVTQVLIPFADQQGLVASVIGESPNDVRTLAIECVPGTDSSDCGFPEPITLTAGPSTLHFQPSATGMYNLVGEIDCKITGTTKAACAATTGVYDTEYVETATDTEWMNTPAITSSTTSVTLSGSDMVWVSVTITAGAVERASNSASSASLSTTGNTSGAAPASASTSESAASASATGSGSSSAGAASATGNGAAGLPGLACSSFAAGLMALPMLFL